RNLPVRVKSLGASVVEVSTGWSHTCARKSDSTLWCWGDNQSGQLGDGILSQTASPVQVSALGASAVQVAAHGAHTCARRDDATLWCWGGNGNGELGNGTPWD